jgi:transposase
MTESRCTHNGWTEGNLTQEEAAVMLGVGYRTFRRHINRYQESRLDGLLDKRLTHVSWRCATLLC